MGIELSGIFDFNEDGSLDLPIGDNGAKVRLVKESDLLAVKGSATEKAKDWETKEAEYQKQLAEANRLREETHQNLLKEQADKEQIVSKYQDYDTVKTRVGELEKELGSHKESVGKYETELTDRIKRNLISLGATEDAIKDKNLDQLRNLEEAAQLFGKGGKPANYDGGKPAGGGAALEFTRPVASAARAYQEKGYDKKM
jgi:hypothetical protein